MTLKNLATEAPSGNFIAFFSDGSGAELFCVCDDDVVTPPSSTIRAAREAPRGQLHRYHYGHFDIYRDPAVKADQIAFLNDVLGAPNRLPPNVTQRPN